MAGIPHRVRLTASLIHAWDDARAGGGRVAVLLGDPGIGKSHALTWLADHIGEAACVVRCRGGDFVTPMANAHAIREALSCVAAPFASRNERDPLRFADELAECLEKATGRALLIDDIHDADPSSVTAVNLALRRAVLGGSLVVVTARHVPPAVEFAEGFDVYELDQLTPAASTALLRNCGKRGIADAVVDQLVTAACGNPLALKYVADALTPRQLAGTQSLPEHLPLVGDLRTVFTRQLPEHGSPARELIDRAAVWTDGSWMALGSLIGSDAQAALDDVERRGLGSLVDGYLVLTHPLLRSAALSVMPAERRRALNGELAALSMLPDDVRLVHRAMSVVGPDEGLVDELQEAAGVMTVSGGIDVAARMLSHASALTADSRRRELLHLCAAESLGISGDTIGAKIALMALLEDGPSKSIGVRATIALATLEAVTGAPASSWRRLHECASTAQPSEAGAVYLRMAIPLGMLGLVGKISEAAETAASIVGPDAPSYWTARIIAAHAASAENETRANWLVDDLVNAVDLVTAGDDDPMAGLHIGRSLSIAEQYSLAAEVLAKRCARSRRRGARLSLAVTVGALGETFVRSSRFDDALSSLDEAIALSMATGQRAFAPFWLSLRARVCSIRGDAEAAAADLKLGFGISDELSTVGARYFLLANAGLVALTEKRYSDAATHLSELWSFEDTLGRLAPQLARWHADYVEALVACGRSGEVGPVLAHLSTVAATPGASRWTQATAKRAHAVVCGAESPALAEQLFDDALAIYDSKTDMFDLARTYLMKAEVCKDRYAADAALHAFRRLGAAPWSARLPNTTAGGLEGLTDAESRVLAAVAEGMTNRQIAKRLDLSVKTVANHLYSIYRKLGVASRTEATRLYLLRPRS